MLKRITNRLRYSVAFRVLRNPRFNLTHGIRASPLVEPGCVFEWERRITVGRNVRFLRGAMVFADPIGSISLGDHSAICRYSIVQSVGGRISIGINSMVGDFCNLFGQGGLTIGDNVMIASGCRIVPNQHTFADSDVPICAQPCKAEGIVIMNDVWLGTNVVVLDGVTIGEGAIIGAGAVVTRSVPPFAICAGVPSRIIRMRPGHELVPGTSSSGNDLKG